MHSNYFLNITTQVILAILSCLDSPTPPSLRIPDGHIITQKLGRCNFLANFADKPSCLVDPFHKKILAPPLWCIYWLQRVGLAASSNRKCWQGSLVNIRMCCDLMKKLMCCQLVMYILFIFLHYIIVKQYFPHAVFIFVREKKYLPCVAPRLRQISGSA
jgi:hypothetical protein